MSFVIGTALLFILIFLALPFLIVIKWKKRPILAIIFAAVIVFVGLMGLGFIQTFDVMALSDSGNLRLLAGGMFRVISSAIWGLPVIVAVLVLAQWIFRRRRQAPSEGRSVKRDP